MCVSAVCHVGRSGLKGCSVLQVYRARLRATGEEVAVKVQRPDALSTISKVSTAIVSDAVRVWLARTWQRMQEQGM